MKNEKLSDRVATRIRYDIKDGKYKAGEKIPAEPELMKKYAVGRSSVREAIKSLAIAGILQVKQGDGTYVNEYVEQQPRYSAEGDHVIPWQTEHVFGWRTSTATAVSAFQS